MALIMLITLSGERNDNITIKHVLLESVMYAKFPFYSIAQMYAMTLDTPVAIMLGGDLLYWVVDQQKEVEYSSIGFSLLCHNR